MLDPNLVLTMKMEARMTNDAIASALDTSEASVRRALRKAGYYNRASVLDATTEALSVIENPLEIVGDCVITADWHVPVYDVDFVNTMYETAQRHGIKTLVIGGDFFNFDSISRFDIKDVTRLDVEWLEGVNAMDTALSVFDRVVLIKGNHDERLTRALGFKMSFDQAMKLVFAGMDDDKLERLTITGLDHCWVRPYADAPDTERFYVCHPTTYSRIPLSTPRALIPKFESHVIAAHAHHCAVGYGMDGHHIAAEAGGLFDRGKVSYLLSSNTFPTWAQGFSYVLDGQFYVTSPGWSVA